MTTVLPATFVLSLAPTTAGPYLADDAPSGFLAGFLARTRRTVRPSHRIAAGGSLRPAHA